MKLLFHYNSYLYFFFFKGAFVKTFFHGIAIDFIECDDIDSVCGCQKFPVTNTVFDGWDGVPMASCPLLN